MIVARHLVVRGRVQGVFFRDWAVATARAAGIAGWVRNRRDGSVEIVAEGEAGAVEYFAKACRHGPPAAQVDSVQVVDLEPVEAKGFERRRTG